MAATPRDARLLGVSPSAGDQLTTVFNDREGVAVSLVSRERETISAESDLTIHKIRILPVLGGN